MNGAPPIPLKLYPEYEAMQLARGVKAAAPTDLFYPDLSPRAPRIAPRETVLPIACRRTWSSSAGCIHAACWRGCAATTRARRPCAMLSPASRTLPPREACVRSGGRSARCSKVSSRTVLIAVSASSSCAPVSTCRSAAWPKAVARSRTGCGAKCFISWRSARRWRRRCRRSSARSSCPASSRPPRCCPPTWCGCSRCCAKRASSWRAQRIRG